jgi:hypothetical protein
MVGRGTVAYRTAIWVPIHLLDHVFPIFLTCQLHCNKGLSLCSLFLFGRNWQSLTLLAFLSNDEPLDVIEVCMSFLTPVWVPPQRLFVSSFSGSRRTLLERHGPTLFAIVRCSAFDQGRAPSKTCVWMSCCTSHCKILQR